MDVHVVLAAEQKTEAASALCILEEAVCALQPIVLFQSQD